MLMNLLVSLQLHHLMLEKQENHQIQRQNNTHCMQLTSRVCAALIAGIEIAT